MKDIEKAIRLGLPAHERNTKHADSFVKGMAKRGRGKNPFKGSGKRSSNR